MHSLVPESFYDSINEIYETENIYQCILTTPNHRIAQEIYIELASLQYPVRYASDQDVLEDFINGQFRLLIVCPDSWERANHCRRAVARTVTHILHYGGVCVPLKEDCEFPYLKRDIALKVD